MNTLLQTEEFRTWLGALKDFRAKAVIFNRLDRATNGNFGDVKALGGVVSEMRIDFGPGYRIYFSRRAKIVYLLLIGGDKSSQARNIHCARTLFGSLSKE